MSPVDDDGRPLIERSDRDLGTASNGGPRLAASGCERRAGSPRQGLLDGHRRRCRFQRGAHRHLPHPVPAVRRGARAGAGGIRSIATATPSSRCGSRSKRCRGRAGCGNRCRRSRGSRIAAAAPERCACRRSTDGSSRRRTRRSPTRVRAGRRRGAAGAAGADDPAGRGRDGSGSPTRDLGVEQLGGVYERVLDFDPADDRRAHGEPSGRRKTTGAFYTPRALTEYLVRRTLAPLVQRAPHRIASSRCACSIRRWAAARSSSPPAATWPLAYESALIRERGRRLRTT